MRILFLQKLLNHYHWSIDNYLLDSILNKKYYIQDELCLKGYFSRLQDAHKEISHPLKYIEVKQYRDSKKLKKTKNQSLDKK